MEKRRVVVTGIGLITPLGNNVETTWSNIISSKSGVDKITYFDISDFETKIAAQVKDFDISQFVPLKEQKKLDKFMSFAIAASHEALTQAGWFPTDEESLLKTGVSIGSGIGGLDVISQNAVKITEKGSSKVSPFFIPSALINLASGHVSIKYGFLGPNYSVVTACSTGGHAIYSGAQLIESGDANVMICGGAESSICAPGIAGFSAARALSTQNEHPTKASRPWDKSRDGFVMGEGAGILVLEEYEHAKKRGAKILAEYCSAGLSGDAYHITSPEPTGRGATNAMKIALSKAKLSPSQIGYVNAHGTSTPMGDMIELKAIETIFKSDSSCTKINMSSTKSSIGHLLGAAGSVEAIFVIKAMETGILPPTLNLENPEDGCENFDLIPHIAKEFSATYGMSNSFGFGGTNISLILSKFLG